MTKIELIKEIYQIEDNDLEKRKEAIQKIKPHANEIMDKFYEKLLQKDDFARFIPLDRIPELKEKQIKFVVELFSEPFDEKLYKKIAKVAIAHYHIKLDPLYMSYGYHLLSELVLELSKKDTSLLPYLKLIMKYFKVSESIMSEEYFAQKSLAESPYRANDLFIAVNELHMAYIRYKGSLESYSIDKKTEEIFEKSLDNLNDYRDILNEAGFDLATIKRFHTEFINEKNEKNLSYLKKAILKPLNDLSVTSYLSLMSSLSLLRAMTDIIYKRTVTNKQHLTITTVKETITSIFAQNFGWAIEDLKILDDEPEGGYEIIKHLIYEKDLFFLCINTKEISNKLYILEEIDLLSEAVKITLYLRSKSD